MSCIKYPICIHIHAQMSVHNTLNILYTLSKRKQDSIKSEKIKSMKAKSQGKIRKHSTTDGGSDSDDEPVSFFSHLEETASSKTTEIETTVVAPLKISSVVATPLDSDSTHSSIDQKEGDDDRSVASIVLSSVADINLYFATER